MLSVKYQRDVTYGERFRVLRRQWCKANKKPVLALAEQFGSKYVATIYNIERQWRVPSLSTLATHAAALECNPWDLLIGVETEYDIARQLAEVQHEEAEQRWRTLLHRYADSARAKTKSSVSRGKLSAQGESQRAGNKRRHAV